MTWWEWLILATALAGITLSIVMSICAVGASAERQGELAVARTRASTDERRTTSRTAL